MPAFYRWDNKPPFDTVLSERHLCQKLQQLVDLHVSNSVQHQCLLLRHCVFSKNTINVLDFHLQT